MNETLKARTWAEISLNNLEHNYNILRQRIPCGCRLMGIVKANAYGHGAKQIALKLQELGADMLGVACLDEALELRQCGVYIPILCLGQTPVEFAPLIMANNITQVISDLETAQAFSDVAAKGKKELTVHIALDTGMTRLGFQWNEDSKEKSLREILRVTSLPGLNIEGMFTHFSNADGDESYTMMQFNRFCDAKKALSEKGIDFEIYHCAASAAMLNYPITCMDMIRPGIALYGYPNSKEQYGLLPVLTLKSRVVAVRNVPAGTFVGYGCTAKLSRDTKLAVLPIGYADGFSRSFSNGMEILIHDCRCPVIGRVCMDMCMVDVTDVQNVKTNDIAVIYSRNDLMDEGSARAGTIPNDLLARIAPRVHRVYMD